MATAQTGYEKFFSRNALSAYDFDPDATSATEIAWVDMRDFEGFAVLALRTVGSAAFTLKIVANSDSDGGGTDADVVVHAVANEPDTGGDWIVLECSAEQIRAVEILATTGQLRYVTAVVSVATGTDEVPIFYVRWGSKFPTTGLTAESIAS